MRGRLMLVLGSWAVLIPGVAGLILQQDAIEPKPPVGQAEMAGAIVVNELVYNAANRPTNFQLLGLTDPDQFKAALAQMAQFDERREEYKKILRNTKAPYAVGFCPKEIAVPYRAAEFLLTQGAGAPLVVDLDQNFGKRWAQYDSGKVNALYRKFEGRGERTPEDTLIALSALVLGQLDHASVDPQPPFDKTVKNGGSFQTIVSKYAADQGGRDVPAILIKYLTTMEFVAELVQADPVGSGCKAATPTPRTP